MITVETDTNIKNGASFTENPALHDIDFYLP